MALSQKALFFCHFWDFKIKKKGKVLSAGFQNGGKTGFSTINQWMRSVFCLSLYFNQKHVLILFFVELAKYVESIQDGELK
jgi:hypothetical protein